MSERVYLDYIATTPVDPTVVQAMEPFFHGTFGNPSSVHTYGQEAKIAIDRSRDIVAGFFGVKSSEVLFTGSATEADNWAIRGVIDRLGEQGYSMDRLHVVTSAIEHKAVLETLRALERRGLRVTYVKPDSEGVIDAGAVAAAIQENTVLVSVMYVNNEAGSIQPIREIAGVVAEARKARYAKQGAAAAHTAGSLPLYFHTDAVQGVQFLDCRADALGYDLLTFSGHKIYGPKGIGGLVVRGHVDLAPLIFGGGQEDGQRSGTENVAGIVGVGAAIALLKKPQHQSEIDRIATFSNSIITTIVGIDGVTLNGPQGAKRIQNNIHISVGGPAGRSGTVRDSETLVIGLDMKGFAVSAGSACSAGALEPSYVLRAMGVPAAQAKSALRISIGRFTTQEEIKLFLQAFRAMLK